MNGGTFPVPVLVVDSLLPARRSLRRRLEEAGYRVLEARSAEEALGLLRRMPEPVVVLAEWDLQSAAEAGRPGDPALSGIALCRALKREREEAVEAGARSSRRLAVVLTSRSSTEDLMALEQSDADDCLFRPFTTAELLKRVRMAVEILALEEALEGGLPAAKPLGVAPDPAHAAERWNKEKGKLRLPPPRPRWTGGRPGQRVRKNRLRDEAG